MVSNYHKNLEEAFDRSDGAEVGEEEVMAMGNDEGKCYVKSHCYYHHSLSVFVELEMYSLVWH